MADARPAISDARPARDNVADARPARDDLADAGSARDDVPVATPMQEMIWEQPDTEVRRTVSIPFCS